MEKEKSAEKDNTAESPKSPKRPPNTKAKTLLIWEGLERPYKKQDRKFYSGMISVAIVLCLFLAFAGQFALIIVLLSLLFATYALYSTPPGKTTYVITEDGVEFKDEDVYWEQITDFFITKRLDETLINIDLEKGLMKRRYLIPDTPETMDAAIGILEKYVERRKVKEEKSAMERYIEKVGLSLKE